MVAAEVAAYRASVEQRLRQAETDRAKAETRAIEQTKRRRVQLALAVTVLLLLASGGTFAWWQDRQATARRIETENREREETNRLARNGTAVEALLGQCEQALRTDNTEKARLALDAAQVQSAEGGAEHLTDRLQRCMVDLAVLSDLDAVDQYRWTVDPVKWLRPNRKQVAAKLRPVIHRFGIVPGVTPPNEAARLVAASSVRARVIAALDLLMYAEYPERTAELRAILLAADAHPYRNTMREAALTRENESTIVDFAKLAADDQAAEQPPGFTALYLEIAPLLGEVDPALRRRRELLMRALRRSPGNLPLIMTLSGMYPIEPRRGPAQPVHPLWLTMVQQAVPQATGDGVEAMVRWYQAGVAVHPRNIAVRLNLGVALLNKRHLDEAIAEFREAIRLAPQSSMAHNNLGVALGQKKDSTGAIAALREAIRLDPNSDAPHNNLGIVFQASGQLDAAIAEFREARRLDPQSYHAHSNLGSALGMRGDIDEAIPLIRRAIQLDPNHARDYVSLAICLQKKGDWGGAVAAFNAAIRLDPAMPSQIRDHFDNLKRLQADLEANRKPQTIPQLEETLKLMKAKLGPDHPTTLQTMNNLAAGYQAAGKLDLALPLFEETLKYCKTKLGADHPNTLTTMGNLAGGYQAAGKLNLALPLYEEILKLRKAKLGADHPNTLTSMGNLGKAYCDAKQGEKAAPLLREFIDRLRKRFPQEDPQFAGLLAQVALDLLKCEQLAVAEEMLRECLTIRKQKQPEAWTTFNTQSLLGGSLLGQKQYAEAEPLLVKGYEGMKAREKTIPPQGKTSIPEALDRLIALYTATNKPDEAKKYRDLRAKYASPKEGGPMSKESKK